MLLLEFAVQSHLQSSNPSVGQSAWESSLPGQCPYVLYHAPTVLIRPTKLYPLLEKQQLFLYGLKHNASYIVGSYQCLV